MSLVIAVAAETNTNRVAGRGEIQKGKNGRKKYIFEKKSSKVIFFCLILRKICKRKNWEGPLGKVVFGNTCPWRFAVSMGGGQLSQFQIQHVLSHLLWLLFQLLLLKCPFLLKFNNEDASLHKQLFPRAL